MKIKITITNKLTVINSLQDDDLIYEKECEFIDDYAFINFTNNSEIGYSNFDVDNLEYLLNQAEQNDDTLVVDFDYINQTEFDQQDKSLNELIKTHEQLNNMFINSIKLYLKTKYQFDFKSFDFNLEPVIE